MKYILKLLVFGLILAPLGANAAWTWCNVDPNLDAHPSTVVWVHDDISTPIPGVSDLERCEIYDAECVYDTAVGKGNLTMTANCWCYGEGEIVDIAASNAAGAVKCTCKPGWRYNAGGTPDSQPQGETGTLCTKVIGSAGPKYCDKYGCFSVPFI